MIVHDHIGIYLNPLVRAIIKGIYQDLKIGSPENRATFNYGRSDANIFCQYQFLYRVLIRHSAEL